MPSTSTILSARPWAADRRAGRAVRALLLVVAGVLAAGPAAAACPPADTFEVWVDDAHTRTLEVRAVDPDEIADPSSFSLGFGKNLVGIAGISVGWCRQRGVQYDELVEVLIERLRELCAEFNRGELSLETYQRRLREIFASIEQARMAAVELRASVAIQALEAGARLDEALGLPERDVEAHKLRVNAALDAFRGEVEAVPQQVVPGTVGQARVDTSTEETAALSRRAVEARLADFERSVTLLPPRDPDDVELIEIWADRGRTRRIAVPALDVEHLVRDFGESLSVRVSYSTPVFSQCVGPDVTWALERTVEYDEAAQLLIVKYRRLCLEYNSGMLCQQEYAERLLELFEAERRAFAAREQLAQKLRERVDTVRSEMGQLLGTEKSETELSLERLARDRGADARRQRDQDRGPSLLYELSRDHREEMSAWAAFSEGVGELQVEPPGDAIEVWVDDAHTRQVRVPALDTDLIADSIVTHVSLQICCFDFGPECTWGQRCGMQYDEIAQLLIVKTKQLCADYNAGLVSQESYDRRRRAIDASVERAAHVRERMAEFASAFRQSALDQMDWYIDLERKRAGQRDG